MKNEIYGMVLAGDERLFVIHKDGRLKVLSVADGSVLAALDAPLPAWDGLALAAGRLYLVSQAGELICFGE